MPKFKIVSSRTTSRPLEPSALEELLLSGISPQPYKEVGPVYHSTIFKPETLKQPGMITHVGTKRAAQERMVDKLQHIAYKHDLNEMFPEGSEPRMFEATFKPHVWAAEIQKDQMDGWNYKPYLNSGYEGFSYTNEYEHSGSLSHVLFNPLQQISEENIIKPKLGELFDAPDPPPVYGVGAKVAHLDRLAWLQNFMRLSPKLAKALMAFGGAIPVAGDVMDALMAYEDSVEFDNKFSEARNLMLKQEAERKRRAR